LKHRFTQIDALVRPPEDLYYKELRTSYRRVRRFLPILLKTVAFRASPAGEPLIEAIDYLKTLDGDKKKATAEPPLDIVDPAWRGYVVCDGKVDLQAYTFCFLDRLRKGLRRRDVFVTTSVRYADPRIGLLEGEAWEGTRPFICRSLGLPVSASEAFSVLRHELDQTYKAVATNFPNNSAARIEQVDGKDDLILTGLDKLDEPDSLIALRKEVQRRLPRAELPEILLEIAARTGFSNEFTHISERDSRASELVTSICAVLVAQACNTGTGPLERNDVPALRRSRLSWVNQNYIRNETLTAG
jgi:Tn3 transposase DDE domain